MLSFCVKHHLRGLGARCARHPLGGGERDVSPLGVEPARIQTTRCEYRGAREAAFTTGVTRSVGKVTKHQTWLSFVTFFASAAVLCYNTAPLTGHGLASPGCRSLGLLCLYCWF
jgi:hypothetical protein